LKLHVPDVDIASVMLQELFFSEGEYTSVETERIAAAQMLNLAQTEEPTLADVYDTILQNWIAPLPREVSVHIRQRKELLARRIAAEVKLASRRLRCDNVQISITGSQRGPSQDKSIALPILPSKHGDRIHSSTKQWPLSHTLPIMPHSAIPSSSIPPSSPPDLPLTPPAPSDPVSRLGRHLKIGGDQPTPFTLSHNVGQLLEHWDIGSDPHTYDWSTTEFNLQEESQDEASQTKREKDRRKRERREKRQERENQLVLLRAATRPVLVAQSSQGPTLDNMASSSQMPSQANMAVPLPRHGFVEAGRMDMMAPMSQVEPGRFGGRPNLKKKKKGRISGF